MGSPPHSRVLGHILALFVTVVWGTTLISSKILLRAFTPLEIMTFRFLIAWAVLFCLSPRLLRPQDFRSELPFAAAGVSGLTLYFLLENTALRYTPPSCCGCAAVAPDRGPFSLPALPSRSLESLSSPCREAKAWSSILLGTC